MNQSELDILAENLTQIRNRLRYTQKDVASELGISNHQIVALETGTGNARIDTAVAICGVYGISLRSALKKDFWQAYFKTENMSTDAAVGFVQAVYTGAVKELSDIYACDSGYRSADPTPLEKFFTQNRFGIVDGDMVIKECKKRADEKRRKRYEQSGTQTAGKKGVNK